jgi:CBS domain-containing protein
MLAREIMIPEPFVAAAGATSAEVALLMRAKDISVVPVVDNPKDRRYLGTISDRDIVTLCVAAGHDPTDCQALEHARTDTTVVGPDTELAGFRIERLDDADTHIRSTIVVVNQDKTRRTAAQRQIVGVNGTTRSLHPIHHYASVRLAFAFPRILVLCLANISPSPKPIVLFPS